MVFKARPRAFRFNGNVYVIGKVAFVKHPALKTMYMKTHACVALVACRQCHADVGEPCRARKNGWNAQTHLIRRTDAKLLMDGT